jgi:hypothetical protein
MKPEPVDRGILALPLSLSGCSRADARIRAALACVFFGLSAFAGAGAARGETAPPSLLDLNLPPEVRGQAAEAEALRRDPFIPPHFIPGKAKAGPAAGLELKAILHNPLSAVAIVNDQLVRVGDTVGGRKVVEIRPDRVVLRDAAGKSDLRIGPMATPGGAPSAGSQAPTAAGGKEPAASGPAGNAGS